MGELGQQNAVNQPDHTICGLHTLTSNVRLVDLGPFAGTVEEHALARQRLLFKRPSPNRAPRVKASSYVKDYVVRKDVGEQRLIVRDELIWQLFECLVCRRKHGQSRMGVAQRCEIGLICGHNSGQKRAEISKRIGHRSVDDS